MQDMYADPNHTSPHCSYCLVIVIIVTLTFAGYRGRCKLFTCQPAMWATIHPIAQTQSAKAGLNYRIGVVRAEPVFRTSLTADGPYDIRIRIELISTEMDRMQPGMYPVQMIEFADRDQWIIWKNRYSWTSESPSAEAQKRLSHVRISPREVYNLLGMQH